ncbi:N-acetyltransferase family protein [Cellulomonas sp. JZ18]|uniref:GNAT family N-acetyltransferase n=1 Tax=Cellulomonas sp. JZ18 TaxID=2654191 RepID=UPI00351BDD45
MDEQRLDGGAVLRAARPGDEAGILACVRALAVYEREPDAVETTEADLTSALFAPDATVHAHVVEVEGVVVGIAVWFRSFSTWTGRHGVYLEDLFVDPAHRGRGYGLALLRSLAAVAVARGWTRVDWAVLDWNAPSIAFYRSLGAVPMDEWTGYRLTGDALREVAAGA